MLNIEKHEANKFLQLIISLVCRRCKFCTLFPEVSLFGRDCEGARRQDYRVLHLSPMWAWPLEANVVLWLSLAVSSHPDVSGWQLAYRQKGPRHCPSQYGSPEKEVRSSLHCLSFVPHPHHCTRLILSLLLTAL